MTEKQLIAKIKELRQIKPRKDWALLSKKQLFAEGKRGRTTLGFNDLIEGMRLVFQHKYAFASLVILAVLIGSFGFAQRSLPGDTLFSLKRISERGQAVFVLGGETRRNLESADRRLDDLARIAQTNLVENLAPAIKEYQTKVSEVAKSLAGMEADKVREIVSEVKKLEEKREEVRALGVEIEENEELDNVLSQMVEREVNELEAQTLTEDQEQALAEVKADFEEGDYSQALEKILFLSQ